MEDRFVRFVQYDGLCNPPRLETRDTCTKESCSQQNIGGRRSGTLWFHCRAAAIRRLGIFHGGRENVIKRGACEPFTLGYKSGA